MTTPDMKSFKDVFEDLCTNDLLAITLMALGILKEWAEADAEHSMESDAPEQAKDDKARMKNVQKAITLLTNSYK